MGLFFIKNNNNGTIKCIVDIKEFIGKEQYNLMVNNSVGTQLILILILTLINGFFAAAEIALVSLDKNKLRQKIEEGDKKAELLLETVAKPVV